MGNISNCNTAMAVEMLKHLLRYDAQQGGLFWRARGPEWFDDGYHSREHKAANWNSRYAGKAAERKFSFHPNHGRAA